MSRSTLNRLFEWAWGFLPDRCQMPNCERRGVRGNENVIDGKRVCDYCHFRMRRAGNPRGDAA
jgi:hypothetical protein